MITDPQSGTRIDEVADGIYRISTPVSAEVVPGGFTFNQYLVVDDEPLLFHTGQHRLFPSVSGAIARVMPVESLRYVGLSHYEADECGALNDFLAVAPRAVAVCSQVAAMTSVDETAPRPARALADGDLLRLGRHSVRWFDTPHVPHGWECGFLFEASTSTLLCGDLFTQFGDNPEPLTEADILGPSEASRAVMDYYAHAPHTRSVLERLAAEKPKTLACMHGSAFRGDGAALLRGLADALEKR